MRPSSCSIYLFILVALVGLTYGKSGVYWGAWMDNDANGQKPPWNMPSADAWAKQKAGGKKPSIIPWGVPWYSSAYCGGACNFNADNYQNAVNYGAIPYIAWQPSADNVSPYDQQPYEYTFAGILAGTQDTYIRNFAVAAAAWGKPFFLRFAWEMNGNWFHWGTGFKGTTANTPAQYVAVWKHVHDIFTSVGATNANWVWCPNIVAQNNVGSLAAYYPGPTYVDWVSFDGYNSLTHSIAYGTWLSWSADMGPTYNALVGYGKPIIVSEFGCDSKGGNKAKWLKDALHVIPRKFKKIAAILYFDIDDGENYKLSDKASMHAWASGISNSAYVSNTVGAVSNPIPIPKASKNKKKKHKGGKGGGKNKKTGAERMSVDDEPSGAILCDAVNQERILAGLSPLSINKGLNSIALTHSKYMAAHKKVGHNPNLKKRAEVKKQYPSASALAESVSQLDAASTTDVVATWLETAADQQNVLSTTFTEMGCAIVEGKDGWYFTAEFGAPKKAADKKKNKAKKKKSPKTPAKKKGSGKQKNKNPPKPPNKKSKKNKGKRDDEGVEALYYLRSVFDYSSASTSSYDSMTSSEELILAEAIVGNITLDNCYSVNCALGDVNPTLTCTRPNNCTVPAFSCLENLACPYVNNGCGFVYDGCSSVNCGTCSDGYECVSNQCVVSACGGPCPDNSQCNKDDGYCYCNDGSEWDDADGQAWNCIRQPVLSNQSPDELSSFVYYGAEVGAWTNNYNTTEDPSYLGDNVFDIFNSTAPFHDGYEGLQFLGTGSQSSYAIWANTDLPSADAMVLSANISLIDYQSTVGLVFGWTDEANHMYVSYKMDKIYIGVVDDGVVSEQLVGSVTWFPFDLHEMKVIIREYAYEIIVDGVRIPETTYILSDTYCWGRVGVKAIGQASFSQLNYRSLVVKTLKGVACPTTSDDLNSLIENLAWTLQADPTQISVVCTDSLTRAATSGIDVFIEGDMDIPASGISDDLTGLVQSGAEEMALNELSIAAVADQEMYIIADEDPVVFNTEDTIVVEDVFGAGEIAGVVVGGTIGLAAAAGGAVVVVKKRNQNKKKKQPEVESAQAEKPKGAGANVFDFSAGGATSITGRSQPKEWL